MGRPREAERRLRGDGSTWGELAGGRAWGELTDGGAWGELTWVERRLCGVERRWRQAERRRHGDSDVGVRQATRGASAGYWWGKSAGSIRVAVRQLGI